MLYLINFEKKHYYKKRGSDIYRKSNYATFYIKLRQDFCISGCDDNKVYKVLSVEKKSLKVVNNTIDDIGLWWLLTFQNSYAEISQLILMTDLINNHALLVSFLECF